MPDMFTCGNAETDGTGFSCWFVGEIDKWCADAGRSFATAAFGLRNRRNVEIKWGVHPKGQTRPGGWTARPGKTAISVLVRGRFRIEFRVPEETGSSRKILLEREGDYVIWREELEHTWAAEEDSRILTVRWEEQHVPEEGA